MMRLLLVRHGETDWNHAGRYQGQIDVPLNAVGRAQAEHLAVRLETESIDVVYSSDLRRARETTAIITRQIAHLDIRLREPHYGVFQGLTYAEMEARYPHIFAAWHPGRLVTPPGGESLASAAERVERFMSDLNAAHEKQTVLVVSHGELLQILLCCCLGLPLTHRTDFSLQNAVLSELEFGTNGWTLTRLNDAPIGGSHAR